MDTKKYQIEFNKELFKIIGKSGFTKEEIRKVLLLTPLIAKKFKEILEEFKVDLKKIN